MARPHSTWDSTKTPHSTSASTRSAMRAPIHNPYDKFTQSEFDAWIGDITGALRRALGQEGAIPNATRSAPKAENSIYDEVGEDSFAELKARRAAKGKQRATYEDLVDEDDELDDREVETSILVTDEDQEAEDSPEYDVEGQWTGAGGEWSHSEAEGSNEGSDGDEEEGDDDETQEIDSDEVIEIEDDEVDEEFPPPTHSDADAPAVEISDPWEGPSTYAEDFYCGGDVPANAFDAHILPTERVNEIYDVELAQDDFVPEYEQADSELPPVQLLDKWEGPRTYAEDFYAGGNMLPEYASLRTPSHLTPATTPDVTNGFLTPGVLTPESLPADSDALETPYDVHETTNANETPTFSMPEEHSDGPSGEKAPVVDQLYTGLPSEPLPEGADVLTHDVLDIVDDPDMPGLHDRASEVPRVSPQGHLDWNSPPAFSSGRPATAAGHLKTLSDAAASRNHADDGQAIEEPEIVVISDEEDEPDVTGLPLGTSDLDIPADAAYDDDDDSGDDSGHDNDKEDEEDEDEGSAEMNEDVEEDAIQGLPEEFGPEIVDMFKDGQLNPEGLIEVQSREHTGDDQFSFDDFESLYTHSEGFAGFEGDESTNMVEEHLEPIVVEDTDFGSLPTPSAAPALGSLTKHAVADFYEAFSHAEIETSLPISAEDPSIELLASEIPSYVPRERGSSQPAENDLSGVKVDDIVEVVVSTMAESGLVEESELEEDDVREQSIISDGFEVATYNGETPAADECQVVEEATDEERDVNRSQSVLSDDANLLTEKDESLLASAEFHVEEGVCEDTLTTAAVESLEPRELSLLVESLEETPEGRHSEYDNAEVALPVDNEIVKLSADHPPTVIDVDHEDSEKVETLPRPPNAAVDPTSEQQPEAIYVPDVAMDTVKPTVDTNAPAYDFHHAHRESSPRMFEPGIPMPVSADPTVPDPASVHSSPADSPRGTSPHAEDQRVSFLHVRSAVPPALLQQLSRSSGTSGLFTPYSQASSGPSSPAIADGSEGIGGAEEIEGDELTSEPVPTAPSTELAHNGEHDVELDADGDIDPDYEEALIQEDETGEHPPLAAEQIEEQPSTPVIGNSNSVVEVSAEESSAKPSEEHQPIAPRELDQSQPEKTGYPGHPTPAASEVDPITETVNATAEQSEADDAVLPLPLVPEPVRKRKRASPPPTTRMTRSRSNNVLPPLIPVAVTRSAKSRGKQKVAEPEPDAPNDGDSMGGPSKQATLSEKGNSSAVVSRESSVVSNSTGAFTAMTPSSPITVTMERSSLAAAFQSDGFLRHHHGPLPHALPPPPPPPPPPVTIAPKVTVTYVEAPKPRSPSPSPVESVHEAPPADDGSSEPPHTNGDTPDEIPGTMAEPSPVDVPDAAPASESEPPADVPEAPPAEQITGPELIPLAQAPSTSTSPVTRSQCRFHKISIPVAENDPRMFFVVPGCSLSNRDVMHEQDIKDEGDLTYDEIHRLRADVPSLDINQDIVAKLALLVGGSVDKDAYYLPQPDERVRMRSNTRHPRLSNVENISARNGLSTRRGVRKTTPAASTSASTSATASPAYSHLSALTNVDSVSDDESTASRPAPKRRRRVVTAPAAVESSAAAGSEPQTKTRTTKKVRANPAAPKEDLELPKPDVLENKPDADADVKRRPGRRRTARDAAAYKPEDDTKGADSEAESEKHKTEGKKTGTRPRGLKRSRTSEEAQVVEKPKRRRVKQ